MKLLLENWRQYLTEGKMPDVLYHGTSAAEYKRIKDNGYNVKELYLADTDAKSSDYAEQQSIADGSEQSIILTLDTNRLVYGDIRIDRGSGPEEWEHSMGQWIFTGNIKDAIVNEEIW